MAGCPSFHQLKTLPAVQKLCLYPTDLGCVHHEIVVHFRLTTATAPVSQSVDSRCEASITQVVLDLIQVKYNLGDWKFQASFWHSCNFLVSMFKLRSNSTLCRLEASKQVPLQRCRPTEIIQYNFTCVYIWAWVQANLV